MKCLRRASKIAKRMKSCSLASRLCTSTRKSASKRIQSHLSRTVLVGFFQKIAKLLMPFILSTNCLICQWGLKNLTLAMQITAKFISWKNRRNLWFRKNKNETVMLVGFFKHSLVSSKRMTYWLNKIMTQPKPIHWWIYQSNHNLWVAQKL